MIKVRAVKEGIFDLVVSLYAFEKNGDSVAVARSLVMDNRPIADFEITEPEPFLKLDPTTAQYLMDSLWDCGLRPSEGSGSAGALAATQKHLEDMRSLVFKKDE
jgi:hypothetical protein